MEIRIKESDIRILDSSSNRRLFIIDRFFEKFHRYFFCVQLFMLLSFLFLIIAPVYSNNPKSTDTIFTNILLLSQFLFWGVWYGGCLLSVIPFGRLWCGMLCPLGAFTQWIGKFGFKRKIPSWMKSEIWLILMFTIVTILGQTLDVRDDPWGMIKLFGLIFLLAIIIAFIYGQNGGRPWCRYFCPIGKILGVISRLSFIHIAPNRGIKPLPANKEYFIQGRLCPTDYNLPYKVSTNNCITCGKCISTQQKAGLGTYFRFPGAELTNVLDRDPNWSEVAFVLLAPGLAAGGFLWLILHQYQLFRDYIATFLIDHNIMWPFNSAPWILSSQTWNQNFNWLDVFTISIYMLLYGLVIALISSILIAVASLVARSSQLNFRKTFYILTYQFTPVVMLTIVIGLCGKFFEVMQTDFGLMQSTSDTIKATLFLISIIWSVLLLYKVIRKIPNLNVIKVTFIGCMLFINFVVISCIWWPAIFNKTYVSDVEKIRQHIVIPQ
ncbi:MULTISPECIES: 4Fe-4S binding protein [unclassified Francisella]|uniref:4Fe-4S binding protein n=1 Tax=unclassified Francisella TaxID=2610885 RepID=UPI002E32D7C8|nr:MULTISPECIES: 4Fe-4S binding protein [unclassified Francisella]MED7820100.1 4Fe-4S binding protein [Francisella sp. 19S2-4]MED7830920.1 4Fe-4S binding protein [Francisella sp. 19S2-10]